MVDGESGGARTWRESKAFAESLAIRAAGTGPVIQRLVAYEAPCLSLDDRQKVDAGPVLGHLKTVLPLMGEENAHPGTAEEKGITTMSNAGMNQGRFVRLHWGGFLAAIVAAILMLLGLSAGQARAIEKLDASNMRTTWSGPANNTNLGQAIQSLGDINGDGQDDFVAKVGGVSANRGAFVLFGPLNSGAGISLSDLKPSEGYRIRPTSNLTRVQAIGDQNGDGLNDVLIQVSVNNFVYYSVADPAADLPKCDPVGIPETRCLAGADPVNTNGDRMGYRIATTASTFGAPWNSGDFDGDGKEELVAADDSTGEVMVIAGGLGEDCDPTPGLCVVDIDSLDAPDLVRISGPGAGIPFPGSPAVPGDVNGDGRDDLLLVSGTDGASQPAAWVVYGQAWQESPISVSDITDSTGYKVPIPFTYASSAPFAPGDVNGDGLADIGILNSTVVPSFGNDYVVLFGQEHTPDGDLAVNPPAPGTGVLIDWDSSLGVNLSDPVVAGLGDLNGDGAGEFVIGSPDATVDGEAFAGIAAIVQSKGSNPPNSVALSEASPASDVLILGGTVAGQALGAGLADAGDTNNDGLGDLVIGSPMLAVGSFSNNGMISLITSSTYYPTATTGLAGAVGADTATLGGSADANGRSSIVRFEYGTSTAYGSTTAPQSIGSYNASRSATAVVNGLQPDTEYHYRTVVENDIGVVGYGLDRTFKTPATAKGPCEVDPKAKGCEGYDYCEANPSQPGCVLKPALSNLIAVSSASKVKRGKKATVSTWITNTGTANATGAKVCLKAPKKLIKGAKCLQVGNLAPGKTALKKFKVRVNKKAKKGKKAVLKLTASANGLGNKAAKVRIAIR